MSRLFTPHDYQDDMVDFQLDTGRNNTWAGMGMGKTGATLLTLSHRSLATSRPTLILGPLRVANSTWPDEVRKWSNFSHFRCVPIAAPENDRPSTQADRQRRLKLDADLFTLNWDNLPWLVDHLKSTKKPWPFETVIADESTRLKGFRLRQGTKRAKAIAPYAHTKIDNWTNLTGTPAPNGLLDLWGQNWFVDAGERLGHSFDSYKQRWFQATHEKVKLGGGKVFQRPVVRPLAYAQEQIGERMRDVSLALSAKDYFPLKDPIIKPLYVELPRKVRGLYSDMEKTLYMEWKSKGYEAVHAAHKSMRLLHLASGFIMNNDPDSDEGPFTEVHDLKLQLLESVFEEAAGMPVLVSYQWKPELAMLQRSFPKGRRLDANPKTIDAWNAGDIPYMWAHPQSAGHGLNLQDGGNILAYYGHWWDLEQHDQIFERIGPVRQLQSGHDRNMFAYYLFARDTADELVQERLIGKRSVQDIVLDYGKRRGLVT